ERPKHDLQSAGAALHCCREGSSDHPCKGALERLTVLTESQRARLERFVDAREDVSAVLFRNHDPAGRYWLHISIPVFPHVGQGYCRLADTWPPIARTMSSGVISRVVTPRCCSSGHLPRQPRSSQQEGTSECAERARPRETALARSAIAGRRRRGATSDGSELANRSHRSTTWRG